MDEYSGGIVTRAFPVTLSDTTTYLPPLTGIYVGVTGDVTVDMASKSLPQGAPAGATAVTGVTFKGVPAGSFMPIAVTKIYATGTTATNLVGLQ